MIQYPEPVYVNTPQYLSYQFKRRDNGQIINLTPYDTVLLEAKLQGATLSSTNGNFVNATNGQVECTSFTFASAGVWDVQFVCTRAGGTELLPGEIIQITVVPNVRNLTTDQIADY